MNVIGLTGGIGSGKSTVAKLFEKKNIPIYISDIRAKELINESNKIKKNIIKYWGKDIYINGKLNRKKLSEVVFKNKSDLKKLNELVHPEVFNDFKIWKNNQISDFVMKEAAILFESGSYKDCDLVITVETEKKIRINRTIQRDGVTKEMVEDRISKQWTSEQRIEASDYVINNNGSLEDLEREVNLCYEWIIKQLNL